MNILQKLEQQHIAKEKISEKEQFIYGCGDDPIDCDYIQSSYNTISSLKQKLGLC